MAKDAKGHGSDAHSSGVEQIGQALQKPGPVPPNSMQAIRDHVGAGGAVGFATYARSTTIEQKHFDQWDKAGKELLKPEGAGYRMASGKSSVYLLPGQLRFGVRQ